MFFYKLTLFICFNINLETSHSFTNCGDKWWLEYIINPVGLLQHFRVLAVYGYVNNYTAGTGTAEMLLLIYINVW